MNSVFSDLVENPSKIYNILPCSKSHNSTFYYISIFHDLVWKLEE